MSDLREFQTDNLFLLIGTNPLPNYVAARLLAKHDAHLHLVHSPQTHQIAQRLADCLRDHHATYVQVNDSDAQDIFRKVLENARGQHGVGLNYTGGTKVMGVHAYRAMEQAAPSAVFSYLDANKMEMVVKRPQASTFRFAVGTQVVVSLNTLLGMHGLMLKSEGPLSRTPLYPNEATDLAQSDCRQFRAWCDQNLRATTNGKSRKKRGRELRDVSIEKIPVLENWRRCQTLGQLASSLGERVDKLCDWLDGKWLENYVLLTIQSVASECQIHDCAAQLEAVHIELHKRKFEFDVAAMRGYQLFAISCTTSEDRSLIKSKLFEVHARAPQMGGDEARVAVVSCVPSSDPNKLPRDIQTEVEEAWDAKGKIRVFGTEHLPKLRDHLKDWFLRQP